MKRFKRLFLLTCLGLFIFTHFFHNMSRLIASRGYFIPADSSIFTFDPTVENSGSGEWWHYGEDLTHYYYGGGCLDEQPLVLLAKELPHYDYDNEEACRYLKIRKYNNCEGFNSEDYSTWCEAEIRTQP